MKAGGTGALRSKAQRTNATGGGRFQIPTKEANSLPILTVAIKQICKLSREVVTSRAMVLQFWMLIRIMPWVEVVQDAHTEYHKEQSALPDGEKWIMGPIQCQIFTNM